MTIRCRSFATAKEPGGLKYYTTNTDTEFNELAFTVGSGSMLPGLEENMMGMRKNAMRRAEKECCSPERKRKKTVLFTSL